MKKDNMLLWLGAAGIGAFLLFGQGTEIKSQSGGSGGNEQSFVGLTQPNFAGGQKTTSTTTEVTTDGKTTYNYDFGNGLTTKKANTISSNSSGGIYNAGDIPNPPANYGAPSPFISQQAANANAMGDLGVVTPTTTTSTTTTKKDVTAQKPVTLYKLFGFSWTV